MLPRVLLIGLFVFFLARALWRLLDGVVSGAQRSRTSATPQRSERMVRDPICGTFVLPSRALSLGGGAQIQYFCSEQCRTAYPRRSQDDHAVKS